MIAQVIISRALVKEGKSSQDRPCWGTRPDFGDVNVEAEP